eukprot:217152_1
MAQLFTVYFPKYHFVLQSEFSITFVLPLPFRYKVSESGIVYVEHVHWQDENFTQDEIQSWKSYGLQEGLTIVSINNINLMEYNTDEKHDEKEIETLKYPIEQIDIILQDELNDNDEVTLTFREELFPLDDAKPLGLTWNDNLYKQGKYKSHLSVYQQSSQDLQYLNVISNKQISASSCEHKYEPSQCRFNNSNSYWKPSLSNQKLGNIWIMFDLGMKKVITQLYIQGNFDHSEYITSLWIDYSDDGCVYKSHPMRLIKIASKYIDATTDTKDNYFSSKYKYVIVDIWPCIQAQFIRLRPTDWIGNIAMRIELYGTTIELYQPELSNSKVVTLDTVNTSDKHIALEALKGIPTDTPVIQVYLKSVVSKALDKAQVRNYGILKADENNYICTFTTPDGRTSEQAMDRLAEAGIGREIGIVSVTNIDYRSAPQRHETFSCNSDEFTGEKFYESIKSRMVVKQVVETVMHGAAFTFDYLLLLLSASIIAVAGLAIDSSVIIVASMLVSPLMGPVLAFTFGVTLSQKNMTDLGLKNELLSLLICVTTGFIFGYLYSIFTMNRNHWPTEEMASRGTMIALGDGVIIASASGIGVALSVLGEYIAAVVGCAISASLLPPAVNCGMLLSFTLFESTFPQYVHRKDDPQYDEGGIVKMAIFSLALTIENVIIISIVSRLMFAIKNVIISNDIHHNNVWQSIGTYQYSKLKTKSNGIMSNYYDINIDPRESSHDLQNHLTETTKTNPRTTPHLSCASLFTDSINPNLHHIILRQQSLRFKQTQSNNNSPMDNKNDNNIIAFNTENESGCVTTNKMKTIKNRYHQIPVDE